MKVIRRCKQYFFSDEKNSLFILVQFNIASPEKMLGILVLLKILLYSFRVFVLESLKCCSCRLVFDTGQLLDGKDQPFGELDTSKMFALGSRTCYLLINLTRGGNTGLRS